MDHHISGPGARVLSVGPGIVRVEASAGADREVCELREQLALCPEPEPGQQPTYILRDAAGDTREVEPRG